MPAMRKLTRETPQIISAYDGGTDLRKLASFYNVSPGTIRNILCREGVQMRRRGRKSKVVPSEERS